jgi:hypothetical protein
MIKAAAAINNFASQAMQTDFVPPIEEPIFVLTGSQLKAVIQEATTPLLQEIQNLKRGREMDRAELDTLQNDLKRFHVWSSPAKVEDLWAWVEELDKRTDIKPQPLQVDRGEILRALIAAYGGKILAKDARLKMRLSKQLFSMLVASMSDYIEIKPLHSDKRKKVLMLK